MTEAMPSVAIIVAAWKATATIGRAIDSALAEPAVTQVIVVDDCSPDDTAAAAMARDDGTGRLTVLRQERNGGPAAARNKALDHVTADWVAVLDSDDYMMPGRIAGLLAHAADADLVADDLYQIVAGDPGPARTTLLGPDFRSPMRVTLSDFVLSNVTREGAERKELGFIKPLTRMELLRRTGIRYREDLRLGEDYELYCRLLAAGARLVVVPATGYVAVERPDSLSAVHSADDLRRLRDCNRALAAIPGLDATERKALDANYASVNCRLQWLMLIDAVKRRNPAAAARAFMFPPPVPGYLVLRLLEQLRLRSRAKLSALTGSARS